MLKKSVYFFYLLLIITLCTSYNCSKKTNSKKKQPNIIFIFADDWGYGDLGAYGNKEVKTPNLDQMANEGTRFTQFHVTSGVCSPSRSSVLTGHFPAKHRVHAHFASNEKNAQRNMPNYLTDTLDVYLPQLLQKAGYKTAHFGKWHLGGGGLPNGDPSAPEPKEYGYDVTRVWNGNGPTWKGDQKWETTRYMDADTTWIQSSNKIAVNATIDFIQQTEQDKPFFVNLWLKDPHTPLYPSEEQKEPYKGFTPDKETYYAVLTDADYHIGRLFDYLKKNNLEENTLLIFSSDNGPANYDVAKTAGSTAGLKGRKVDIYQGGVVVPFIVKWKGKVNENQVDSTSVLSAVDFLPAFANLANIKLPKDYKADGEDISPIFQNKTFTRHKPLFWEWRTPNKNTNHWAQGAVRKGEFKLLFNDKLKREELYNIVKDPYEKYNILENHQEITVTLKNDWYQWKATLPK